MFVAKQLWAPLTSIVWEKYCGSQYCPTTAEQIHLYRFDTTWGWV